jgi:hypothetical protein
MNGRAMVIVGVLGVTIVVAAGGDCAGAHRYGAARGVWASPSPSAGRAGFASSARGSGALLRCPADFGAFSPSGWWSGSEDDHCRELQVIPMFYLTPDFTLVERASWSRSRSVCWLCSLSWPSA